MKLILLFPIIFSVFTTFVSPLEYEVDGVNYTTSLNITEHLITGGDYYIFYRNIHSSIDAAELAAEKMVNDQNETLQMYIAKRDSLEQQQDTVLSNHTLNATLETQKRSYDLKAQNLKRVLLILQQSSLKLRKDNTEQALVVAIMGASSFEYTNFRCQIAYKISNLLMNMEILKERINHFKDESRDLVDCDYTCRRNLPGRNPVFDLVFTSLFLNETYTIQHYNRIESTKPLEQDFRKAVINIINSFDFNFHDYVILNQSSLQWKPKTAHSIHLFHEGSLSTVTTDQEKLKGICQSAPETLKYKIKLIKDINIELSELENRLEDKSEEIKATAHATIQPLLHILMFCFSRTICILKLPIYDKTNINSYPPLSYSNFTIELVTNLSIFLADNKKDFEYTFFKEGKISSKIIILPHSTNSPADLQQLLYLTDDPFIQIFSDNGTEYIKDEFNNIYISNQDILSKYVSLAYLCHFHSNSLNTYMAKRCRLIEQELSQIPLGYMDTSCTFQTHKKQNTTLLITCTGSPNQATQLHKFTITEIYNDFEKNTTMQARAIADFNDPSKLAAKFDLIAIWTYLSRSQNNEEKLKRFREITNSKHDMHDMLKFYATLAETMDKYDSSNLNVAYLIQNALLTLAKGLGDSFAFNFGSAFTHAEDFFKTAGMVLDGSLLEELRERILEEGTSNFKQFVNLIPTEENKCLSFTENEEKIIEMTRIFEGIIGFPRSCIPPLDAYNAIYNQLFKNAEEKKNNDEPEQVAQGQPSSLPVIKYCDLADEYGCNDLFI